MNQAQAKRLASSMTAAAARTGLRAYVAKGRLVFAGGNYGEASILIAVSSVARAVAHWQGYRSNNGQPVSVRSGALVASGFEDGSMVLGRLDRLIQTRRCNVNGATPKVWAAFRLRADATKGRCSTATLRFSPQAAAVEVL